MTTHFSPTDPPLNDYPRPQLARSRWQNLNGLWEYAIQPANVSQPPAHWKGQILVPFCIESAGSGVQRPLRPGEALWYHRSFAVDGYDPCLRTLLHFGAVDESCQVWVNGQKAGGHRGGYLPFHFEISKLLRQGDNELLVRVTDDTGASGRAHGKQSLTPGGIWYTAVSGIWQTVWLEQVPQKFLRGLAITPDLTGVTVAPSTLESGPVRLRVYDGGNLVAECYGEGPQRLQIPHPKLWTPETPHLYRLTADFGQDHVESYFGLRTFSVEPDSSGFARLCLNGRPYFQKGLLDQGYWPDGLYTAPTDEALFSDIVAAKRLGFNLLRKHVKVEAARWYYHCDRLGMLVWQDMPNGGLTGLNFTNSALPYLGVHVRDGNYRRFGRLDESVRREFLAQLAGMVRTLYNAASICLWGPFNEGWGQFDSREAARLVRRADPTRLIDAASGWHDQGAGDIRSMHRYVLRLYAPKPEERRAFCLTEYGGYSYIVPEHIWKENGKKQGFGYRMYPDRAALTAAYCRLHQEQVLPLLPKGLSACIYTQLTDVETEVNGLLTYDRAACKVDERAVLAVNQALVL